MADRSGAEQLARILEGIPQLVWTASADGRLDFCNAQWRAILRPRDAQRLDEIIPPHLHESDRRMWLDRWHAALSAGTPYEVMYRIAHGPGDPGRWYLERGEPLWEDDGNVKRWFITATMMDAQQRTKEELESGLQRRDAFLATILHELRNPLAPIANAIDLLGYAAVKPQVVNEARAIIQRQLRQLTRLVDDLLDVSRIARGKIELRLARIDLSQVLAAAMETARPLMVLKGHELSCSMSPGPIPVVGDLTRLSQVFTNLLINAAKYTQPGGHILLTVERGPDVAIVRVRDDGIGIEHEKLAEIFNLFAQVSPASYAGMGGLGIGLAVARQLIELHHGSIEAQSEGAGKGSEFTIRLPLDPDSRENA